jgi:hypothetical protein
MGLAGSGTERTALCAAAVVHGAGQLRGLVFYQTHVRTQHSLTVTVSAIVSGSVCVFV